MDKQILYFNLDVDKTLNKFTYANSKVTIEDEEDFEASIPDIMADIYQNLPGHWDTLHIGHCYETIGQSVGSSSFPNKLNQSVELQYTCCRFEFRDSVHPQPIVQWKGEVSLPTTYRFSLTNSTMNLPGLFDKSQISQAVDVTIYLVLGVEDFDFEIILNVNKKN
ncbi:hypothetical protein F8M41_002938 [Gigaspora margarita]|uniref:Uncharacterized protein n=1 Tax=Gigaspora margarita TaxID=4874 RepID=A0A8H3XCR7_GIGMA|nr:hypothetical protein F8M41_002938 [Gigaspora margarita]